MTEVAQLYVNNDRIDCPNRGNIDLDICLFCDNLINVNLDNVHPFIRCTPPLKRGLSSSSHKNRKVSRRTPGVAPSKRTEKNKPSQERSAGIDPHTIEEVISTSLGHPEWGISRVTDAVQQRGVIISRRKVGEIFKDKKLVHKGDRLRRLVSLAARHELELDNHQSALLEKYDLCFRDRHLIGEFPGHYLLQASVAVPVKSVRATLYTDIVIDTYSGYTFGHIHQVPSRSSHVLLLQQSVLPFFNRISKYPKHIFTMDSAIFNHPQFTQYLTSLNIEQQFLTETPAMVHQFWNEFLEPWVKSIPPHELARQVTLESQFQRNLDEFNRTFPLPGFPNVRYSPQNRIDGYLQFQR